MDDLNAIVSQFTALDASLYGFAVPVALLIRFCRAYWVGFGDRATLLGAAVMGGGGAWVAAVDAAEPRPVAWILAQAVSLVVAVLVVELASRKVPGLPADNHVPELKAELEAAKDES